MHRLCPILATITLLSGCVAPGPASTSATTVIRGFMVALYSNDHAGYDAHILPCNGSELLLGESTLTEVDVAKVRHDVAAMRLLQTDPYRYLGADVAADRKGRHPTGTKATFMTQFRGVNLVIPVVNTVDGWKVDVRYWLAMRKEYEESDPEVVAKKFLYFLIQLQEKEIRGVTTSGADLKTLLKGQAPIEDQYYALALEMQIVQATEGEAMRLPGGRVLKAGNSTESRKWVIGMYGPYQLLFELAREGDVWKTVPRDYLSIIGIGAQPSARITEQPKNQKRLGM